MAEVLLGLADLRGVAQRGAEQPRVIGLERDDALALRQYQPPERHHPLAAHGFTNEREGLLSDRLAGRDVIRGGQRGAAAVGVELLEHSLWIVCLHCSSTGRPS